ncbi:MAG: hypothetical protein RLZZ399_2416 [Verrucomicrobiota bacterium]|jgi:hypothetical protein
MYCANACGWGLVAVDWLGAFFSLLRGLSMLFGVNRWGTAYLRLPQGVDLGDALRNYP